MELDAPSLVRYWIEFDLSEHRPDRTSGGRTRLDGGDIEWRLLGRGVGVTGYDADDCLSLVERALGCTAPPVVRIVRSPSVSADFARGCGNVAWRGVWFPPLNRSGPSTD